MHVPHVEVADMRAFDGDDSEYMTRRNRPCAAAANGHHELVDQRSTRGLLGDCLIKGPVDSEGAVF